MDQVKSTQNPAVSEDEIDLFELWEGLVEEKLTILYSFLAVVFAALIYVLVATPVYQAKTYLLPPDAAKVIPMNVLAKALSAEGSDTRDTVNTTESIFKKFRATLVSRNTLKEVFNQYALAAIYVKNMDKLTGAARLKAEQKAFEQFVKDFSVADIDKKEASAGVVAQLSLPLSETEVAKILNTLVLKASQSTVREISSALLSEKEAKMRLIEQKISGARQVEKSRRLDRIAQLDEAIKITKQLNLTKPVTSGPTLNINNMNAAGQGDNIALYLLGSDLLEAEKRVLEQRTNDDAFILNLRNWQEALQLLKSLKIEPAKFGVVQVDQEIVFAEKIKPKKSLILAVSGVLGIILGVFIALVRRAIKKRKESVAVA